MCRMVLQTAGGGAGVRHWCQQSVCVALLLRLQHVHRGLVEALDLGRQHLQNALLRKRQPAEQVLQLVELPLSEHSRQHQQPPLLNQLKAPCLLHLQRNILRRQQPVLTLRPPAHRWQHPLALKSPLPAFLLPLCPVTRHSNRLEPEAAGLERSPLHPPPLAVTQLKVHRQLRLQRAFPTAWAPEHRRQLP